jgi:predicted O-linked N-acetylglucosamine transferase (SPINDLY family)
MSQQKIDEALRRGDLQPASMLLQDHLAQFPADAASWRQLGIVELNLGRITPCLVALRRATQIAPNDPGLWADLGSVLHMQEQLSDAENAMRRAAELDPTRRDIQLKLAAVTLACGHASEALALCETIVRHEPNNLGALHVLGDAAHAATDFPLAIRAYSRALQLAPNEAKLYVNLALAEIELQQLSFAKSHLEKALQLDPKLYSALAYLLFTKRQLADWDGLAALSDRVRQLVGIGVPGISPFGFLAEPVIPAEQLACARTWSRTLIKSVTSPIEAAANHAGPLRVAFVSNGFGAHPTGLLIVAMLEKIAPNRLQTHLYALAANDGSAIAGRLRKAAYATVQCEDISDDDIVLHIRRGQIDIAIDLRGYGGGARPGIFARRAAPLQINWLAFPATTGAPWMDAVLADRFVLPESLTAFFSEAAVYLPSCFQPSDSSRRAQLGITRAQLGFSDDAVVLCCFNNSYKFSPPWFAAVMEILQNTPTAVLWLLSTGETRTLETNLRGHAKAHGVAAERLVFSSKCQHEEYLARLALADLFLDTWPYGAHTTASDALFAGCPVLTVVGENFASRVAGSLNHALGLPECNMTSVTDYVRVATAIASDPQQLRHLREKLANASAASGVFDMAKFAHDFCDALERLWHRRTHQLGLADG